MGETRVDLLHLLEDLRDAYVGPAEETILTEIVANSLDSGATRIAVTTDPIAAHAHRRRRRLAACGAASWPATTTSPPARRRAARASASRASGSSSALLVCRGGADRDAARGKPRGHDVARWRRATARRGSGCRRPGSSAERGTAVRLTVDNALSPLLDPGFVETALRRHFQPLFDPTFAEILPRSLSDRRGVRGQRRAARARGARAPGDGADRRAARAQAQAVGGRLPGPRPGAAARGSARARRSARSARSSSAAGTGSASRPPIPSASAG